MEPKNTLSKRSQPWAYVWFHLHEVLEQEKLTDGGENENSFVGDWLESGQRELSGVTEGLYLYCGGATWVCTHLSKLIQLNSALFVCVTL